jgi:hypothetical protein
MDALPTGGGAGILFPRAWDGHGDDLPTRGGVGVASHGSGTGMGMPCLQGEVWRRHIHAAEKGGRLRQGHAYTTAAQRILQQHYGVERFSSGAVLNLSLAGDTRCSN